MKVVITGAGGQLGKELLLNSPVGVDLHVFTSNELDIVNQDIVNKTIESLNPDVIINSAAYTDVDRAESESERAYSVNRDGVAFLAEAAGKTGSRLVHISTDFVFDGSRCRPYLPEDKPNPLGVYGASKLAGEERVAALLADALIIRTSWLYSVHGPNFVKTMLRLMGKHRELGVVSDQIGTPTWANELARGIWRSVEAGLSGKHHWTDSGVASWYDFASAIYEEALALNILKSKITIKPIRTNDYPTPAQRPSYSVLNKDSMTDALNYTPPHWRVNLRKMLRNFKGHEDE
ncbi:MAG: dTDP-4-dehydrorhamnose reductase [Thermodesulfobacteriota bacterium]